MLTEQYMVLCTTQTLDMRTAPLYLLTVCIELAAIHFRCTVLVILHRSDRTDDITGSAALYVLAGVLRYRHHVILCVQDGRVSTRQYCIATASSSTLHARSRTTLQIPVLPVRSEKSHRLSAARQSFE